MAKKTWFDNYQEEKNQIKNEQELNENKDVEMKEEVVERKVANHKYTTRSKLP